MKCKATIFKHPVGLELAHECAAVVLAKQEKRDKCKSEGVHTAGIIVGKAKYIQNSKTKITKQ